MFYRTRATISYNFTAQNDIFRMNEIQGMEFILKFVEKSL